MGSLYLSQVKKKAQEENACIVFEDEASFRQSPTLYQTWARRNSQPKISSTGERNTQKIYGVIELHSARFVYKHQEEYFNHVNYVDFLENHVIKQFYKKEHRVYLIQDNASYHKKSETYEWFNKNRKYIEVFCLPRYYPELNAIEPFWHYTRMRATHNRFHETKQCLCKALFETFAIAQKKPCEVINLMKPFF